MTQIAERVASSTLVALIGGFLISVALAASTSTERAVVIWLLTVLCCGVVIGSAEPLTFGQVVKRATFPAIVLSATPVLYFYFVVVYAFLLNPNAPVVTILGRRAGNVSPFDPRVISAEVSIWVWCFLGSLLFISVSVIASRLLLEGAEKLYRFGPHGISRVRLIVLGVAGALAAVLSLLSVLAR
jgi:hypothetical protein